VLKTATIGMSVDRRFELEYTLAYPSNGLSSIESKTLTAFGHLYFGLQIEIGISDLSKKLAFLDKYFFLSGKVQLMVDLGNIGSTVTHIWDEISSVSKTKAHDLIKSVAEEGGELTVLYDGDLEMNLKGLTDGFLPDIKINLSSVHFLVTLNGGSTGLPMGIYMYFQSNRLQGILDAITDLANHLGGILKIVGFNMPKINVGEIDFGIFANTQAIGFKFDILGLDVQCIYQFAVKKGSCKFDDKIFTAILAAGKWVIKEAKKLFDEAGKEIAVAGKDIKDFSEKSFNDVKNGVTVLGKDLGNVAKVGAKAIAHTATAFAKDIGHAATTVGKDIGHTATTVGKDIGHTATTFGKSIGHTATTVGKDIGHTATTAEHTLAKTATTVGKTVGHAATTVGKSIGHAATTVGKDMGQAAKKVGSFFKHIF